MFKRKILFIQLSLLSLFICYGIFFILPRFSTSILILHSVEPDVKLENRHTISTRAFEQHMRFLRQEGYNVVPLDYLVSFISEKKKIPAKTIAITFDDGYKDVYTQAFPILKKYNIPITLFVVVNYVGKTFALTWEEIKEMQSSRLVSIGSHTLHHRHLTEIKLEDELRKEIFDSKRILEEKLARPVTAFSYPYGTFNQRIKKLVIEAGYKFAVDNTPWSRLANRDVFALSRLEVTENKRPLFYLRIKLKEHYNFIRDFIMK